MPVLRAPQPQRAQNLPTSSAATDALVVLVVDDIPSVRRALCRALSRLGATTVEAGSIGEAMEACEGVAVDVALLDVVLDSGETGAQLATALAAVSPETEVVYMSGFDDDELERWGVPAGLPTWSKQDGVETLAGRIWSLGEG